MRDSPDSLCDNRVRLPVDTILDGGYLIEGEVGAGGFGITYLGRDQNLGILVAIKEYFPVEIGNRDSAMSVNPTTLGQGDVFIWGREGFVREAQMLASLKHPNIVRVLRYFEANNTAYMVLEFEAGKSLGDWLSTLRRPPTQAELDRISIGLMDALQVIHNDRMVHRDIAPNNIIIRPDLSPVLLDFGAARYEIEAAVKATHPMDIRTFVIVKAHYSPPEQRSTDTRNRGPWTDIYALGATLYRAVTGKTPMDAHDRVAAAGDEDFKTAATSAVGNFRQSFLTAIDRAMSLKRHDRPQTIASLRAMAFDATPDEVSLPSQQENQAGPKTFSQHFGQPSSRSGSGRASQEGHLRGTAVIAVILTVVGLGGWMLSVKTVHPTNQPPVPRDISSSGRADQDGTEKRDRVAIEAARNQLIKEKMEREAAETRERAARENAEKELAEANRRIAREKSEREAAEARERVAREKADREISEARERDVREKTQKEAIDARERQGATRVVDANTNVSFFLPLYLKNNPKRMPYGTNYTHGGGAIEVDALLFSGSSCLKDRMATIRAGKDNKPSVFSVDGTKGVIEGWESTEYYWVEIEQRGSECRGLSITVSKSASQFLSDAETIKKSFSAF